MIEWGGIESSEKGVIRNERSQIQPSQSKKAFTPEKIACLRKNFHLSKAIDRGLR